MVECTSIDLNTHFFEWDSSREGGYYCLSGSTSMINHSSFDSTRMKVEVCL